MYVRDDTVVVPNFMSEKFAANMLRSAIEARVFYQQAAIGSGVKPEVRNAWVIYKPYLMFPDLHDVIERVHNDVVPFAIRNGACHGFRADITKHEGQLNVHHDGDFFRWHQDASAGDREYRRLSWVWYLHHEPRRFQGGRLFQHEPDVMLQPMHNTLLAFGSQRWHMIEPVSIPGSTDFEDGRFSFNGFCCV